MQFDKLIYTGSIDSYFDYMHGELPYRSLNFDFKTINAARYQETCQVNFPNEHDYTRITEFNHFLDYKADRTTIAYEYPTQYVSGLNEPYYPIPKDENDEVYRKYADEAKKISSQVLFVGRLAEYKYYNMDQIVSVALSKFENEIVK